MSYTLESAKDYTDTEVTGEDFWDRAASTLTTKNANDKLQIDNSVSIVGSANAVQLNITGNGTQTAVFFNVEDSSNNEMFSVNRFGETHIRGGSKTLIIGADGGNNVTLTDATNKVGRLMAPHYTNAEEPVLGLMISPTSTRNDVNIGGGSSLGNTAMYINFYTAADTTTVTGTKRMEIDEAGLVTVGATGSAGRFNVIGSTDIVQCYLKGHSTQTNQIFLIENSVGADLFTVSNAGIVIAPFLISTNYIASDIHKASSSSAEKTLKLYGGASTGNYATGANFNAILLGNQGNPGTFTNTTGHINSVYIFNEYNQASGDASNSDLTINRIETAVGSGTQLLCDMQVGGTSKVRFDTTGSPGFFGVTPPSQASHIVDADGTIGDITTKFNTLLADLENYGLLASS